MASKEKKKIIATLATTIASISLLLGATFDNREEILGSHNEETKAIIEQYQQPEITEKKSIKKDIKELLYKVPIWIRKAIFLPMWYLGTVLLMTINSLTESVLGLTGNIIVSFIFHALLLFVILAVGLKIIFPDLPWNKILSKKTIIAVIFATILMTILDWIITLYWPKYGLYKVLFKLFIGTAVMVYLIKYFSKQYKSITLSLS